MNFALREESYREGMNDTELHLLRKTTGKTATKLGGAPLGAQASAQWTETVVRMQGPCDGRGRNSRGRGGRPGLWQNPLSVSHLS